MTTQRPSWRTYLHPADPDYEDPPEQECDPEPPYPTDDPTYLGPPDYEGSAAYRHNF
jgi:hypothetical protein